MVIFMIYFPNLENLNRTPKSRKCLTKNTQETHSKRRLPGKEKTGRIKIEEKKIIIGGPKFWQMGMRVGLLRKDGRPEKVLTPDANSKNVKESTTPRAGKPMGL